MIMANNSLKFTTNKGVARIVPVDTDKEKGREELEGVSAGPFWSRVGRPAPPADRRQTRANDERLPRTNVNCTNMVECA
jgi:hypothetical protein